MVRKSNGYKNTVTLTVRFHLLTLVNYISKQTNNEKYF